MKKIRVTLDIRIFDGSLEEYDKKVEDLLPMIQVEQDDVLDGVLLFRHHPDYPSSKFFFLDDAVIVDKDIVEDDDNRYYVVQYEYISGEYGIPKQRLFEVPPASSIEKEIENYFKEFFGETTIKDSDHIWTDRLGEQAIKVGGWQEVPAAHARIIQKYLY